MSAGIVLRVQSPADAGKVLHAQVGVTSANGLHSVAPGPDLTGEATLALAVMTGVLACVAFWQGLLSRIAIVQSKTETERAFGFENLRQSQAMTPIIVAEASAKKATFFRYLNLRNVGQGPAINVRFSGLLDTSEFSAAQYSVAAIAPSSVTTTALQLHKDFEQRWPIKQLLIRYEDIFGNTYATEYQQFDESSEWYVWRRPWLGKELGEPRPDKCSEDEAEWGFASRKYYDAAKALF